MGLGSIVHDLQYTFWIDGRVVYFLYGTPAKTMAWKLRAPTNHLGEMPPSLLLLSLSVLLLSLASPSSEPVLLSRSW